jgi:uncharacterized protein (DUF885 family)
MLALMPLSPAGASRWIRPRLGRRAEPLDSAADHAANLARDRALPRVFASAIARYREGMAQGITSPGGGNPDRPDRCAAGPPARTLAVHDPADEPFTLSAGGTKAVLAPTRLRAAYREATLDAVYPAYRACARFWRANTCPPRAQRGPLAASGRRGSLSRLAAPPHHVDCDPARSTRWAWPKWRGSSAEMEVVKASLATPGPLPRSSPTSASTRAITRAGRRPGARLSPRGADRGGAGPNYFVTMPRTPLLIMPHPAYRARFEAGAATAPAPRWQPAGRVLFNTFDLKSRFLTGIATLYLHEGAPGHHFQISLAQENPRLPDFQRYGGNTAYVEGWALYAETLGYPMGLYDDPMQHWGTLDDEMLRAMRLVVDTGLHSQGWSREQALDYMLANSGMGRSDAQAEVDRYIADPGQAVAYKIGALAIQQLRDEAEKKMGARFDVRVFHQQVLGSGALPLPVLEDKVHAWMATD